MDKVRRLIANFTIVTSASLLVASPTLAEPTADLPTPLEAVLSAPSDGPVYAFDLQFEDTDRTLKGRIDPSAPEGNRVTLANVTRDELDDDTRKTIETIDKEAKGDIWCRDFAKLLSPPLELIASDELTQTFRFQPKPEDADDAKFMKHLTAEITVWLENPDVKAFRMYANKAFKPAFVAKVKSFDMTASCARGPDGRAYREQVVTQVSGSAMGQSFDEQNTQIISNLEAVSDQSE